MAEIAIGFGGDLMIGRLVNDHLAHVSPGYIWGNVLPALRSDDLNIVNLEAALTHSNKILPKIFNFKALPRHVQTLLEGRIGAVNLAINHVLDFSESGLIETLETLENAHIPYVGAGRNLAEAARAVILTAGGIRIGILGCTDNEPDWEATADKPGTRYVEVGDIGALKSDIARLRDKADIVILSMHWGPNMKERPSRSFVSFAHALIDAGADIVHGHSAHIFQGVEVYKDKLIMYDTGDFVDDYYVDPLLRNDRSFLFVVKVGKEVSKEEGDERCRARLTKLQQLQLMPILISNFQVNFAKGNDAAETIARMRALSKELHTDLTADGDGLCYWFD